MNAGIIPVLQGGESHERYFGNNQEKAVRAGL